MKDIFQIYISLICYTKCPFLFDHFLNGQHSLARVHDITMQENNTKQSSHHYEVAFFSFNISFTFVISGLFIACHEVWIGIVHC